MPWQPEPLRSPIKTVRRARNLRQNMTLPEVLLWQQLRKRPGAFKFRRQFPITPYIADFACLEARLIVEIDGEIHNLGDQPHRDMERDDKLSKKGFRVLRISAQQVLKHMDDVIAGIVAACREAGPPPPSANADGPPPRSGEDFCAPARSGEELA